MEWLSGFFGRISAELASTSLLNQLLAFAELAGFLALVVGITTWIVRRVYLGDRAKLRERVDILRKQNVLDTAELKSLEAKIAKLEQRLREESPCEWLIVARRERQSRIGGSAAAARTLEEGMALVREDLRRAAFDLATHYYDEAGPDRPETLRQASDMTTLAAALKDGNDLRLLRDGIMEIEAEAERLAGRFDPKDARWRQHEFLPDPMPIDELQALLEHLMRRLGALFQNEQGVAAQRLTSRMLAIAKLSYPADSTEILHLRVTHAQATLSAGDFKNGLDEIKAVEGLVTSLYGPEHWLSFHARHVQAAALDRIGETNQAKAAAAKLLEDMDGKVASTAPLVVATRSIYERAGGPKSPLLFIIDVPEENRPVS